MALVVSKTTPSDDHRVRTSLAPPRSPTTQGIAQRELTGGGPWPLAPEPALAALRALREHPLLGDRVTCHLGVKTGANEVFLDPPVQVEPELVRWAIRGRDVRPFRAARARRLLWPCDRSGRPLAALPSCAEAYLAPYAERLRCRADYREGPLWTLFRTTAAAAPHRLVWADLARRLTAVALADASAEDQIPLNTCYVVAMPDADRSCALAAWLNSTWIRAAARLVAPPAASGFARFTARVVAGLPLPDAVLADHALAEIAREGATGRDVQQELDGLTARHLGLAPAAERALAAVDRRADDRR